MKREFCISDIHGCVKTFRHLTEEIILLSKEDTLYLLGDYISRGPDSKGVIDYILYLREQGYHVECLKGNHESLFEQTFNNRFNLLAYIIKKGGYATFKSFHRLSISTLISFNRKSLEKKYIDFLDGLKYYIELDSFWLVHAGFNHSAGNVFEDKETMLWIKDYNLSMACMNKDLAGKKVIHGHTPRPLFKIERSLKTNSIIIDGGCVNPKYGNLVALEIHTFNLYHTKNRDF